MTDQQYYTNLWLSRMWDANGEIEQLIIRRDRIISSLSGIGKYDDSGVVGGSDSNPTESKNLEYSELCQRIEKLQSEVAKENTETLKVINRVEDTKLRGMMIGHYLNHLSWKAVGKMYYYGKSRTYDYRAQCLDAVAQFIPKEAFRNDNKFQSLKEWTKSDSIT